MAAVGAAWLASAQQRACGAKALGPKNHKRKTQLSQSAHTNIRTPLFAINDTPRASTTRHTIRHGGPTHDEEVCQGRAVDTAPHPEGQQILPG